MNAESVSEAMPAAAEGSTAGWWATARLLGADRFFQFSLVIYALALVSLTSPAWAPEAVADSVLQLVDPVVLGLTLAALLWDRGRTKGRERRFWDLLACAWACWLMVDVLYFFELPIPILSAAFAADSLHILYYFIFALAVDLRPHLRSDRSLVLARRRLESVAGLAAIFGLLFYFGIVVLPEPLGFSLSFVPRDRGLTTLLLVRLSLDVFLLGRLLYAAFTAHRRWSQLYLLLATGMFFFGVRDALSVLQYEGLLSIGGGRWFNATLLLPGFVILMAARYRHLPLAKGPNEDAVTGPEETAEVHRPSPIAVYALLIPAVHFLMYPLGLLEEASRSPREIFSFIYILGLGAMAWFHQGIIAKDARRHREALREAEERLFRSQRLEAVGRLAGGIAHDFNNYLTVIQGYSEMLGSSLEDEEALEDIGCIEDAADRAAHLTSQLLAIGRRQVLKPEALDLNEVVRGTGKLLRSVLGEDVTIDLDLGPSTGLVQADLGQTEQVMMNLAINARDAMPGGGTLSIRTRRVELTRPAAAELEVKPGSYVCLVVSDTGDGMTEEVRAQVFEPFFTTKELGRGTGLGLSTVYGIVTQSGGAVSVESAVGEGTEVRILLPTAGGVPEPEAESSSETEAEPMSATVLLVEDEDGVRRLTARALEASGFRVLQAASGNDALARFADRGDSIDLLITDVVMPGMDGPELAVRLTDRWPDLKVLFVSGHPTEMLRKRRAALPASMRFFQKPFTPKGLTAAVREVLSDRRSTGVSGRQVFPGLNPRA